MKTKATIALFGMALPLVAGAQESVSQKQEQIEKTLESVLSKAGIAFSGRATGEYVQSTLDGSTKSDTARATEPVSYTQVDFDLRARPNAVTTVRSVFRMHLDWPNFFGAPYTPFETRWLSIDGKALDMIYYSAGDMSVKWSPYTIYGNDVGFLYTPRMFAQMQEQAMAERFLGNNVRNLQGAQAGIRAAAPDVQIDSFNVGFIAAKLNDAANSGDNLPAYLPYQWGDFDRWAMGGRADVTAFKGLTLGGSYIDIRDLKGSYEAQDTTRTSAIRRNRAEVGSIMGGRFAVQLDRMMELPFQVGLNSEVSMSSWEYDKKKLNPDSIPFRNTASIEDVSVIDTLARRTVDGMGLGVDLSLGYNLEKTVAGILTVGFVKNDSGYRNDLVQSQTFKPSRILNSIQDKSFSHYSTFDALYRNVHRFVPEVNTNGMAKNPIEKVSYTNQVGHVDNPQIDSALQIVLPGGAATANRTGPRFGLDVGLMDGAITLVGNGWMLATVKDVPMGTAKYLTDSTGATHYSSDSVEYYPAFRTRTAKLRNTLPLDTNTFRDTLINDPYRIQKAYKIDYQKINAGVKIRAEKFLGDMWTLPIELTTSYEMNTAKSGSVLDYKANILNIGGYFGVWKRIALMGAYQTINTEDKVLNSTDNGVTWVAGKYTTKQTNIGAGLEYKITEGSYATFLWTKVDVEYPEDKFLKDPKAASAVARDFSQNILNAKLTVGF
jgi:hypothetical protein